MQYRLPIDSVNRYILAKQHLTSASAGHQVLPVVRAIGPTRGAPPITPYLSLWARIKGFRGEQLDDALYSDRSLVRIPCLRSQLCLIPTEHLQAYLQANKPLLQETLDDLNELILPDTQKGDLGKQKEMDRLTQRVLEVVSAGGPLTNEQLSHYLPELNRRLYYDADVPELGYSRLGTRLLPALCARGLLIRTQPRGGWWSNVYSYSALSAWLPDVTPNGLSPQEALRQVIWYYVRAYGPVTVGDITQWVGGFPRQEIVSGLMSFRHDVQRVQLDHTIGDYYMAADQVDEALKQAYEGPQLILLPAQDSLAMAYSDTSRILEDLYRDRVYGRFGEALGTVWIDGRIVGTWQLRIKTEAILITFFEPRSFERQDLDVWAAVDEKARSLAAVLGFDSLHLDVSADPDGEADPVPIVVTQTARS